jgi:plastocyanin
LKINILFFIVLAFATGSVSAAQLAEITGRVVIDKVLTKERVTLPSYDFRGGVVAAEKPTQPSSPGAAAELSRVVIYLEGPGLPPVMASQATLTQKHRRFDPEVVVVPVGSTISFPNEDPLFHNVFSLSRIKEFDLGYYPRGETRTVKFDRPGVVQVYCHIHPDMNAAILVTPSSVWTRPAPDGSYSLSGVPPGSYNLVAWHKSAGFFRQHLVLTGGNSSVDAFRIPVRDHDLSIAPKAGNAP